MPELPDVVIYIEGLRTRIEGISLRRLRILSPFVLRTVVPSPDEFASRAVIGIERIGKRIAIEFEGDRYAVIHLMIAGRLQWLEPSGKVPKKIALALFEFDSGSLLLTEAGSKRRASIHLIEGRSALDQLDPGGLEVLDASLEDFQQALQQERHTLKRRLTDPHTFSGIGNAYSDEILHRAQLSPVQLTTNLSDDEVARLFHATQSVLREWIVRLREQAGGRFPTKVTAFRPEMAVHGRYGLPCPVCGTPVQRIVYSENETNYCARCQTGGRLLADRALSRLLRSDWPRSIDDLE